MVNLVATYAETTVKVFSRLGQVVINESFETADKFNVYIEGTTGMYFLEINTEEGKTVRLNIIKK